MNNNIGIDPSLLESSDSNETESNVNATNGEVVESLDVPSKVKPDSELPPKPVKNKKTPKDKNSGLKKTLFVFIVLLLMTCVGYGLFFYLNQGTKFANKNNNSTNTGDVQLKEISVNVDGKLSDNLSDYGEFSNVDISKCTLNTIDVDLKKVGEYAYSIICNGKEYTSKISVVSNTFHEYSSYMYYAVKGQEVLPSNLTRFKDNDVATISGEIPAAEGGPYLITLNVKGTDEYQVHALLEVLAEAPKNYLICRKSNGTETVIDKIPFNNSDNYIAGSIRMHEFKYENDDDYKKAVMSITFGSTTINSVSGFAIPNYTNKTVTIVEELKEETLKSEISSYNNDFSTINNHYTTASGYTCNS